MALNLERDESLVPRYPTPTTAPFSFRNPRQIVYVPTFFSNYPRRSYNNRYTPSEPTTYQYRVPFYQQHYTLG